MKEQSPDRETIFQILDDRDHGWLSKDARQATTAYADDAVFTNAFGHQCHSRVEVEQLIDKVFEMSFVMAGSTQDQARDIRFVRPDVALVRSRRARKGQRTPSGEPLGTRDITHLRVLERSAQGWQIVSHLISDVRSTEQPRH